MSSRCGPTSDTPRWISSARRSVIAATSSAVSSSRPVWSARWSGGLVLGRRVVVGRRDVGVGLADMRGQVGQGRSRAAISSPPAAARWLSQTSSVLGTSARVAAGLCRFRGDTPRPRGFGRQETSAECCAAAALARSRPAPRQAGASGISTRSSRNRRRSLGSPLTTARSSGAKTTVRSTPISSRGRFSGDRLSRARLAWPGVISTSSCNCRGSSSPACTRARMIARSAPDPHQRQVGGDPVRAQGGQVLHWPRPGWSCLDRWPRRRR